LNICPFINFKALLLSMFLHQYDFEQ